MLEKNERLCKACESGDLQEVKNLLNDQDDKADVNFQGLMGKTPLHVAAENGHLEIVKHLLSHKANLIMKDQDLFTPLEIAVLSNQPHIVNYICSNSLDNDIDYAKCMYYAVQALDLDTALVLMDHGAILDSEYNGGTPFEKLKSFTNFRINFQMIEWQEIDTLDKLNKAMAQVLNFTFQNPNEAKILKKLGEFIETFENHVNKYTSNKSYVVNLRYQDNHYNKVASDVKIIIDQINKIRKSFDDIVNNIQAQKTIYKFSELVKIKLEKDAKNDNPEIDLTKVKLNSTSALEIVQNKVIVIAPAFILEWNDYKPLDVAGEQIQNS